MIYAVVSSSKTNAPATTGSGTQIGTSAFNTNYNNNMYVGFKYTSGQVHGTGTSSTILRQLETWYNRTIGTSPDYSSKIDVDAGFCNDRTSHSGSGTGTTQTYYAAYNRLINNKEPSLLCMNADDIFKTNVGLITADEVSMGGMVYSSPNNTSSYLYTNSSYWTISPSWFISGYAYVFYVWSSGFLNNHDSLDSTNHGVRPVINLKANTLFEEGETGLANNPYVVIGT